jgi:hypothetical protein
MKYSALTRITRAVRAIKLRNLRKKTARARREFVNADAAQIMKLNQIRHTSDIDEYAALRRAMVKSRRQKRRLEVALAEERKDIRARQKGSQRK